MNTRIVDQRTLWTVLAMETALALPIISLPTQGDRVPGLLADATLLGASVGVFAVAGLVGTALSRQEAAELGTLRHDRALAASSAVLPAAAAVLLVGVLRPELLGTMWLTLARIVELALTPLGWLLAWLASLFPRGPIGSAPTPPPTPVPQPLPDVAALAAAQEQWGWLVALILFALLLGGALAAML